MNGLARRSSAGEEMVLVRSIQSAALESGSAGVVGQGEAGWESGRQSAIQPGQSVGASQAPSPTASHVGLPGPHYSDAGSTLAELEREAEGLLG